MAAKFTTAHSIVVDCSDLGFGEFNVLIVSEPNDEKNLRHFYLRHPQYGVVMDMFGSYHDTDEEAVEIAYACAPDYIPMFIEECFNEE